MVDIVDFEVRDTPIDGLRVLTMKQVTDDRGTVREFFRASAFAGAGHGDLGPWRQVNVTETRPGGVRGMHAEAMTKLVAVAAGRAFGAWVDLRPGSDTFGAVVTVDLEPGVQVLVPPGVANGFQALGDAPVQYMYCFDTEWEPGMAGTAVTPLDPALNIDWPIAVDPDDRSQISEKDLTAPALSEVRAAIDADGRVS